MGRDDTSDGAGRRPPAGSGATGLLVGALLAGALLVGSPPAAAGEHPAWAASVGAFDLEKRRSSEGGLEYRHPVSEYGFALALGGTAIEDGAFYLFAGLQRPFLLAPRWRLTPGLGIALYEEGESINLGGVLEFRSSLELARRIDDRFQVGVTAYHLSNGGLYDVNPGSNSVVLTIAFSP